MAGAKSLAQIAIESDNKIRLISQSLSGIQSDQWALVVNGSFARREVTGGSDFDFFILYQSGVDATVIETAINRVKELAQDNDIKLPSEDGVFGRSFDGANLSKNIGGDEDTNKSITSRVLFLLEGHAVTNLTLLSSFRKRLIERYIQDSISDHQLGLFLLNDFIRYYRTVCVDFEFKTFENRKPWGIRNIKLIFSGKLMYFSGVLMVAEMAQRSVRLKREIVEEFANLTPIERVQRACGTSAEKALLSYENFLNSLDDETIRNELEATSKDGPKSATFRNLKDEGQHFSSHLLSALHYTYPSWHPIHRALVL